MAIVPLSPRFIHPVLSMAQLTAVCREARLNETLHILLTTHNPPLHSSTYIHLLQNCIAKNALSEGKLIHSFITDRGFTFARAIFFQNKFINMYAKCGSLVNVRKVFDEMTERDVFSWNIIIAAYRRHGLAQEALTLFHQMQRTGVQPDQFTFASILPACAKLGALEQGMDIHQSIIESCFLSDLVVGSALIDMYAKCGHVQKARELFDKMPQRDVVSWNAMIAGYAQNGLAEKALENFKQMQRTDAQPNQFTFASVLPACAQMGALEQGMDIHRNIIEIGFLWDVVVMSALIDMYSKCGSVQKARNLFDKIPEQDVVSWTAMIAGYVQNGFVEKALETFKQMERAGVKPNSATFSSILPACAKVGALEQGEDIHQRVSKSRFLSNVEVGNALIDMYAKCGSIQKACEVFDTMPQRDAVSWTAMIAGYAQDGLVEKALETFKHMQLAGVKPDSATFVSILPACAKLGALEQGMGIHQSLTKSGFLTNVLVLNALIDMYAKCGNIQKAHELFDTMPQRDVVSWNAMIAGYAMHGYGKDTLKLLELMKYSGTDPDHVSFGCVLFACSHTGLVDEGCKFFNGMTESYYIMPTMDHYVCIVDLLIRAGYLEEALNFIIKMLIKPDVVVWMCLLGSCRSYRNIGLGEFTATLLFELDPTNATPYVLLSDIYAEVGRWGDVQKIRKMMKDRGVSKIPGCSWIEVHKMVHAFCVSDRSSPQTQEIYAKFEKLSWEI